jgi:ADP-ribose pyrophosphatase YjhB (NUDIX family)
VRHSVRVLLLDEDERVLLFRGVQPDTGAAFWFPPGGGIEEGEDAAAAARREIAEETGLRALEIGPEVWRRRHVFTWRGVELDQRERWFVAQVAHFQVARGGMTATEQEDLTEARWWSAAELEATTDELVPRALASHLRALLADGPPAEPIDVGV